MVLGANSALYWVGGCGKYFIKQDICTKPRGSTGKHNTKYSKCTRPCMKRTNVFKNKKGIALTFLFVVIALLALAVLAIGIFRDWIPGMVTVAAQLGIIDMKAPETVEFTAADLQTHRNLIEEFLQRVGDDLVIEVTLKGELHRSGIIGETCYVCSDHNLLVQKKIPFKDLRRGIQTHRVTGADIIGGAEEDNMDGIDFVAIDGIHVFVNETVQGFAYDAEEGFWEVRIPILDEKGKTKYDARSNKPLMMLLTTLEDVQFHNREVQFTVKPAYTYQEKPGEDDPNE
jgi:hypothetical protein